MEILSCRHSLQYFFVFDCILSFLFVVCRYGLAGYICTRDIGRMWRVSEALEFGMIGVNGAASGATIPFGGMKESGLGNNTFHDMCYTYIVVLVALF